MTDITIPPEAVEAAARAIEQSLLTSQMSAAEPVYAAEAIAAIRAAIAAWPGHHIHEWQRPWLGGMNGTDLILPLQEPSDE